MASYSMIRSDLPCIVLSFSNHHYIVTQHNANKWREALVSGGIVLHTDGIDTVFERVEGGILMSQHVTGREVAAMTLPDSEIENIIKDIDNLEGREIWN